MECRPANASNAGMVFGIIVSLFVAWLFVLSLQHKPMSDYERYKQKSAQISWTVRNELCKINLAMNGSGYKGC